MVVRGIAMSVMTTLITTDATILHVNYNSIQLKHV